MKKSAILSIVAAVVIGCVLTSARGQTSNRGKAAPDMPFKGKVLLVNSKSDDGGVALRNFSIKTFGGTEFMVGEESDPDSWVTGHTAWIAVSDISHITEFKDIEEYTKAAREAEQKAEAEEEADQRRRADITAEQIRKLKAAAGEPTKEKPDTQE
jgi:hypothetical protein